MTGPTDPPNPGPPQDPSYGGEPQYPSEQYPSEQYPSEQYPGQPYPAQQYPGQPYPGQPYPGQPYPGQPYPGQQYPGQPAPAQPAGSRSLWERLGPRAHARPQPRLGVTFGGLGVGLAVLGVIVWSVTYLIEGLFGSVSDDGGGATDDSRRFLGAGLAAVVVVLGYLLILRARSGALVTAGIAASALGIPVMLFFLTLDLAGGSAINVDAVVWVSVIAYLATYLFVRGARGHSFYLGVSLYLIWNYVVDKVDSSALTSATNEGSKLIPGVGSVTGTGTGTAVDYGTVAATSLVFGLGYYAIAFLLDRAGRHGVAVAFVVVGLPATAVGIGALFPDLDQVGVGLILLLIGTALAYYGGRFNRRVTTWIWSTGAALGGVLIVAKIADTGTSVGISLIVLGVIFVALGWVLANALHEAPEIDDTATVAIPAEAPRH